MSAYNKSVRRTFSQNIVRFVAITAIILLGISFVSGLGEIAPKITNSLGEYLEQQNVVDIIIKSKSAMGFEESVITELEQSKLVSEVQGLTVIDMVDDGGSEEERAFRYYYLPIEDIKVNSLIIQKGRLPEDGDEVLIERPTKFMRSVSIGEFVNVMGRELEVVGIVGNPLTYGKEQEPSTIEDKHLSLIIYQDSKTITMPLPTTDVHIKLKGANDLDIFGQKYLDLVNNAKQILEAALGEDYVFLTLEQNVSWNMAKSYAEKIQVISLIFPIFFIAVAALVVLTTMTRLIEEERSAIACYKTLGFGKAKIALKYILFSLGCSIIGSTLGMLIGLTMVPALIYPALDTLFFMPKMTASVSIIPGVIASGIMLAVVAAVTLYVAFKSLREKPATLLRPAVPPAGRKVFLEKIPIIWNRLKFRYKSTIRNVFRYMKHLIMTVVSIAGSGALVVAGLSLSYVAKNPDVSGLAASISESLSSISAVIVVFAGLLCALVIFNLTNMNIAERKREIATLKVLGYFNVEVSGYIFREILIMAIMGIAVGLPLGYGLVSFVFGYLDMSGANSIPWYLYLAAAALVLVFVGIVDLLLIGKIRKTDMNASLKHNE